MIFKLSGIVEEIGETLAVIDCHGVGYGVFMPSRALGSLSAGSPASVFVETIAREDGITLYGFTTREDKELFNLLTSVQGVGPKASLAMLSALSAAEIAGAIAAGDTAALSRANGIGQKSAARICAELKDKIAKIGAALAIGEIGKAVFAPAAEDAVSALCNLGYGKGEAARNVAAALSETPDASVGDLIRRALAKFT